MASQGRDVGISELVEYLNRPEIHPDQDREDVTGWSWLNQHPSDLKLVANEIRKCRESFPYASRNYIWITTKERHDVLLKLNESQELILDRVNRLKSAGKPQKLICLKARQLGASTLIEAMIAWRTIFFTNVNAIILSNTPDHAQYLFRMMQNMYDRLPWWLQPMCMSRKIEEGLVFHNPVHTERRITPGLNSQISVQAANMMSGVGQGRTVNALHASEIADWTDDAGESIIEGDLGHALAHNEETFAIIESTAKGFGNYFHRLWTQNVELGEMADWETIFLPFFFEKRYVLAPPGGWVPPQEEEDIRARVLRDWVRCDSSGCRQYQEAYHNKIKQSGKLCPVCRAGTLHPHELKDNRLYWHYKHRLNARKDEKSWKHFLEEMPLTPEEAFQISGIQVFPQDVRTFVTHCLMEPIARGYMSRDGDFHGVDENGHCPFEGCDVDHQFEQLPILVWEYPQRGVKYVIGVDVAEGMGGKHDYSVAVVNKIGSLHSPDEQVATFRANDIDPVAFAYPLNWLGRWYNEGCMSIEINKFDTTFAYVRNQCQYPNLYRWKQPDTTSMRTNFWGWLTTAKSKPRLWQTAVHWLRHRMWVVHSKNLLREMETFAKENAEDRGGEAAEGAHDDEIIAALISLYCSHDSDWDDKLGLIPIRRGGGDNPDQFMYRLECRKCNHKEGVHTPEGRYFCLECGSQDIQFKRNATAVEGMQNEWEQLEGPTEDGVQAECLYELM